MFRKEMAAPQTTPDIVYENVPEVIDFRTTAARVASGRIAPVLIVGRTEDVTLPGLSVVFFESELSDSSLQSIDTFSVNNPNSIVCLVLSLPPVFADTEWTERQLALVSAMVRPCDFVVLQHASTLPLNPFFWKTDGGIPPGKLLVHWKGRDSLNHFRGHNLAGFFAQHPSDAATIRRAFPPTAFRVDHAVLDFRRHRFEVDHAQHTDNVRLGVDAPRDDGELTRRRQGRSTRSRNDSLSQIPSRRAARWPLGRIRWAQSELPGARGTRCILSKTQRSDANKAVGRVARKRGGATCGKER